MQTKNIIAIVIAAAGLIFGAYNWISYFRSSPADEGPVIQALRPQPNKEIAALEQAAANKKAGNAAKQQQATSIQEGKQLLAEEQQYPDTVGRNPFLWPEEIRAIAAGELIDEEAPVQPVARAALPELKVSGLLRDKVTGSLNAIIDGKVFSTGDMVGEEKVVEITDRSVVLESGGRTRTLNLESEKEESTGKLIIKVKKNP